jgi:hypothetical protein
VLGQVLGHFGGGHVGAQCRRGQVHFRKIASTHGQELLEAALLVVGFVVHRQEIAVEEFLRDVLADTDGVAQECALMQGAQVGKHAVVQGEFVVEGLQFSGHRPVSAEMAGPG